MSSTSTNPVQNKVVNTALNGKANSSHKHNSADINSLDAAKLTGTIDIARLPQGALDRLVKVTDDTARFKLTTKDVQLGDTVQTLDNKKMYYVVDESKLSSADGYAPYTADTATSVPWSGITGKPSSYTPSSHTHDDRYYTKSEMNTKLGTKVDLSADGVSKAINQLSIGTAAPIDADYYVSQSVGGGTTTTSYHRRPMSALWNYIKSKADSVYAKVSHTHTKSEIGLGNVDNTADANKSVKYATSAGSATKSTGVVDYGSTAKTIQIGYGGDGISGDNIKFIAGYTTGNGSDINAKIKDVSKDALKSWLGLGLLAYSSATIPTNTNQLTNGAGFTTNTGTITGIKMNGASKGTSGVVDLGTVLTGGKQSTISTADGGSNIYTFSDGSTITIKNGSKGSTGATGSPGAAGKNGSNGTSAIWFTGTAVTGTATSATAFTVSGSKAGDMYLNTSTYNVYRAFAANSWVYVCNIKGATGAKGADGKNGANGINATTTATGTSSVAGLTKLYTGTGTAIDGTMTQNAIKSALDGKSNSSHTHNAATQSANGLMSAADKKKLDGIATGATAGSGKVVYQSTEPTGQSVNDSWLQAY